MRRIPILFAVLALLSLPSWAANQIQSVTVAQLNQWLTSIHGQSDGKVAKQLQNMSLVESLTPQQLAQMQAALPGHRSQDELTILADTSNLLLPTSDLILSDPPPLLNAQGAILSRAVDYIVQTLPKVPDFYATRFNSRFEDTPASHSIHSITNSVAGHGGVSMPVPMYQATGYMPLHRSGQSTEQVRFTAGAEMHGGEKVDGNTISRPENVLSTAGEFGPILAIVLDDAMHGAIEWSRWQQSPAGKLAVFHYSVADGKSTCGFTFKRGGHTEKLFQGYSGEIAVDPASGAILHLSLLANNAHSEFIQESSIVLDYGSVALGGTNYILPLKGVAILEVSTEGNVQTQIGDAAFSGYRLVNSAPAPPPAQ